MSWGRMDDRCNDNAKLLALSDAAYRMYWCGNSYANKELTDGFLPEHIIHTFGVRARDKGRVVTELCSVLVPGKGPLWHRVAGGYQIHDYLDHNDSRTVVIAKRERAALRQERFRAGAPGGQKRGRRHATGNALHNASINALLDASVTPLPTPSVTAFETTDPRTTYHPSDGLRTPAAPAQPCGKLPNGPDNAYRLTCVLVRTVLAEGADWTYPGGEADLVDELKTRAAKLRLDYQPTLIRKAIEAVRVATARRAPGREATA